MPMNEICWAKPTVQTLGELDTTEVVPSPFVLIEAMKFRPNAPLAGRFEIVGVVGVACPTEKDCAVPSACSKLTVPAVCAVSVQVPTPTNETVRPSMATVQTSGVLDVTVGAPSLLVVTDAGKVPLKTGLKGMFEMVGGFGATGAPSAAVDHGPYERVTNAIANMTKNTLRDLIMACSAPCLRPVLRHEPRQDVNRIQISRP